MIKTLRRDGLEATWSTAPRWAPLVVVFFASACVMIIEVVAGRLVARHVGSSLYTWTSIIAVVLAGISVGNLIGGRIADRTDPSKGRSRLADLLGFAGVASLSVLWLHELVFGTVGSAVESWPLRILMGVTLTFLVPSIVLGTVSPLVAKWALDLGHSVGRTVGSVYACGSLGAIAGTLLTGFFLIAWFGTTVVIGLVALALASVALLVHPSRRQLIVLAVVVTALAVASVSGTLIREQTVRVREPVANGAVIYATETSYQSIVVRTDHEGLRFVVMDDLIHGYVDADDPSRLVYEYLQIYAVLLDRHLGWTPRSNRSLHLGGGAYTFPRYVVDRYPANVVTVAEIDPAVTLANQRATGLTDPPPFTIVHADARQVVKDMVASDQMVGAVFSDAFQGYAVPYHLATREFLLEVADVLEPGGFFAANVIDVYASGRVLGAFVATAESVFPYVAVIATRRPDEGRYRDTFVVLASRAPLAHFLREPFAGTSGEGFHVLSGEEVRTALNRAGYLVLTDEYAPVDQLVATWPKSP